MLCGTDEHGFGQRGRQHDSREPCCRQSQEPFYSSNAIGIEQAHIAPRRQMQFLQYMTAACYMEGKLAITDCLIPIRQGDAVAVVL